MAVVVRDAASADAAAIAGIHVRAWRVGYRGLVPDPILDALSVPEREARWSEILRREAPASPTLVAERDGELVGFCSIIAPARDEDAGARTGEIAALYVHPDSWRTGAGGALLGAALDRLREGAWHEVTLWVFAANARARTFYARFAFAADGREADDERTGQAEVRLRAALREPGAQ